MPRTAGKLFKKNLAEMQKLAYLYYWPCGKGPINGYPINPYRLDNICRLSDARFNDYRGVVPLVETRDAYRTSGPRCPVLEQVCLHQAFGE